MRMNKMDGSRGCPSGRWSLTTCHQIRSLVVTSCLSWVLLLSTLLWAEEDATIPIPLQPAVPIAQRMEHRRTVLMLGDNLTAEPLSGEAGGTVKPDPLNGIEQRHAAIRVVDRRRPPDSSKLPPGISRKDKQMNAAGIRISDVELPITRSH